MSYEDSVKYAEDIGGELLSRDALRQFLKERYVDQVIFEGQDKWVAVKNSDGSKDWI